MPPKRDLKAFLKQEVKKARLEAPPAPTTPQKDVDRAPLALPGIKSFKKPAEDSLFGGSITTNGSDNHDNNDSRNDNQTNERKGRDATSTKNRDPLVSASIPSKITSSRTPSKNPELDALKKELETLVMRESTAGGREKLDIRKQKADLIARIGLQERAERRARVNRLKEPFNEAPRNLPEPITPGEKKILMRKADLIAKARAGSMVSSSSPKRRRDELEEDLLDGEDRLRLGIKKTKAGNVTGHWRTTINDYMPESQVNSETFAKFNSLSPEEKMADRMDMNEYLRCVAKVDRIDKKWEKKNLGHRK
ncbi:hypothetical protein EG329_001342 [Mollisiaceae sp. DMI_Dod_QoI]|nr:hypothetical protein EG329_001342 [Helotiales sp. DMI_Dod_QoI]